MMSLGITAHVLSKQGHLMVPLSDHCSLHAKVLTYTCMNTMLAVELSSFIVEKPRTISRADVYVSNYDIRVHKPSSSNEIVRK